MTTTAPQTAINPTTQDNDQETDAPKGEIALYAFGNIEAGIANQFFSVLQNVMVVAMMVNPLLIGLMLSIKTLIDAVTDPIMGHITDNTRSRWGRRRPYILVGGVSRILLLLAIVAFFPRSSAVTSNLVLEGDKQAKETYVTSDLIAKRLHQALVLGVNGSVSAKEAAKSPEQHLQLAHMELKGKYPDALMYVPDVLLQVFGWYPTPPMQLVSTYLPAMVDNAATRKAQADAALKDLEEARASGDPDSIAVKQDLADNAVTLSKKAQENADKLYISYARLAAIQAIQAELAGFTTVPPPGSEFAAKIAATLDDFIVSTPKILAEGQDKMTRASKAILFGFFRGNKRSLPSLTPELIADMETALSEAAPYTATFSTLRDSITKDAEHRKQRVAELEAQLASARERQAEVHTLQELTGRLIANRHLARDVDSQSRILSGQQLNDNNQAFALAQKALAGEMTFDEAFAQSRDILAPYAKLDTQAKQAKTLWGNISSGIAAFMDPSSADQRGIVIYVTLALILFTVLTTIQSVPYYAMGIEIAPSYDGRTLVMTYRSIMDKISGLMAPFVPLVSFMAIFSMALDGLFWVALVACAIGIPSTVLMVMYTRERTHVSAQRKQKNPIGFWKSIYLLLQNFNYVRIFLLYILVGLSMGLFGMVGFYLNIYWVMGSALSGAALGAYVQMFAWVLGLFLLPLLYYGCKRFEKHVVMRFAVIMMAIGCILKWWCYLPGYPERQFIIPFFFSIGIASYYSVLSTMMADVTDEDELRTGERREGMFGATNAFLMKLVGTFTPILAGAILVASGFEPALEYAQDDSTIFNMRVMDSWVPGLMMLLALLLLWRYPLTRARVDEIKAILRQRRSEAKASETASA